jgi:hypothetical protein
MSEYQYFEFLAIDRPLSAREMDHLRAISTRARITPVSFVNEYNWGSLRADPVDFMRLFFDAHVYLANWGEALFMVRLPLEAIDEKTLEPFCTTSHLTVEKLPDHWLLTWSLLGETEEYDPFDFIEETGWMARLAPVREELLRGDLRSLSIGWLRAMTTGEAGVDAVVPAAMNGLQEWTGAQMALAEFLDVDKDLLAGAGMESRPGQSAEADETVFDTWLDQLSQPETRQYLRQLLAGQGVRAEREVKRRFTAWQATRGPVEQGRRRTVADLRQLAERAREQRMLEEAGARREAEAVRKKLRDFRLAQLALDFPKAWKSVQAEAGKGHASAYDAACQQLVDLRDAYDQQALSASFQAEFRLFLNEHRRRKALVTRLVKAGLCQAV